MESEAILPSDLIEAATGSTGASEGITEEAELGEKGFADETTLDDNPAAK